MQDKQIRITARISPEDKEEFLALCHSQSINASDLLRQLVKKWVNEQKNR